MPFRAATFLSVAFFAFMLAAQPAGAATCTFTNGEADNDYNNPPNWDCTHVPVNGDDVVLADDANVTSTPAGWVVSSITVATGTTLTISSGASLAASSTVTVAGVYAVGAGAVSTTALTVSAGGTFSVTTGAASTTSLTNAGTITLTTGTVTSTSDVSNSGTITVTTGKLFFTGNATSTGTITFSGAGLFDLGGHFTNTGSFTPNTGTVQLTGTAGQNISGTVFYHLTTNKSGGTATLTSSSTVLGALTTVTGGGLNVAAAGGFTVLGEATIGASTTFTVGAGSSTVAVGIVNAGTLALTTGTLSTAGNATSTGTLTITTGTLTVSGNATSTGTITFSGAGIIDVVGALALSGTFTPSTGTIRLSGTGNLPIPAQVYYNLDVTKSSGTATFAASSTIIGALTTSGGGTVSAASAGGVAVIGASSIGSGTTYLVNAATSTFASTLSNAGTITITSGVVTTTGALTNSGSMTLTTGRLEAASDLTNTGTFSAGTSELRLLADGDQEISSMVFSTVSSTKTGGTVTFTASSTIIAAALMNGAETWSTDNASGALTIVPAFTVPVGSTFDIGAGSATSVGAFSATGTVTGGTGTLSLGAGFDCTGGTFTPETGTVRYVQTTNTSVSSTVYYNIEFSGGVTYTLAASTTAIGTTVVRSGNELDLDGNTYTGLGTFSNAGTITLTAGTIIHPAESVAFTDSSGSDVTSITTPETIYVTVQDSNVNLDSSTAETVTITLTTSAAAGSDSESVTLTETGVGTGIFRGSMTSVGTNSVAQNGSRIEVTANGTISAAYTDSQDSSDSNGSDTAAIVYAATASTDTGGAHSTGGGGGGGGGVAATLPAPVYQVTGPDVQALLNNLVLIGVATSSLVKLPDDGNPKTQEDTAVYYIGADGKRHAFPHAKVYFTWYGDFGNVQTISAEKLATIPLGENVRYKPGAKMVKFTTDPKVYAVSLYGTLRGIASEQVAKDLYGLDWNKQIDDISDAFYTNYAFGPDILSASDFNVGEESQSARDISMNLGRPAQIASMR